MQIISYAMNRILKIVPGIKLKAHCKEFYLFAL